MADKYRRREESKTTVRCLKTQRIIHTHLNIYIYSLNGFFPPGLTMSVPYPHKSLDYLTKAQHQSLETLFDPRDPNTL